MKRGAIVVAAAKGAYSGKPRPALVVQTDLLNPTHPSLVLLPITTERRDLPGFRIPVTPTAENGLREPSDVMVDKPMTVPRDKVQGPIGHLDAATLTDVNRVLTVVLGLV